MAKFMLGVSLCEEDGMVDPAFDTAFIEINSAATVRLLAFRDKHIAPLLDDKGVYTLFGIEVSLVDGPDAEFRCADDLPDGWSGRLENEATCCLRMKDDETIPPSETTPQFRGVTTVLDDTGVRWKCYEKHVYKDYITNCIDWETLENLVAR